MEPGQGFGNYELVDLLGQGGMGEVWRARHRMLGREAARDMPKGRAGLFTGFVRQSFRREIERDNPLFAPASLLTERDVRRVTQWKWKSDWELPERGPLVPKLVDLAFGMQDQSGFGGASQVSIDLDDALDLIDDERDEDIVRAGVAASVLDEDERWWATAAARRWWSGEGTADGARAKMKHWCAHFRKAPEIIDQIWETGPMTEDDYKLMKKRLAMTESELDTHLEEFCPGGKLREPYYWHDERYISPAQPVTGLSWFEAVAYTNWLSAQTGSAYRLPTEAEWEAAARGREGRIFAWGDVYDPLRGNVRETRVQRATPVGIFPGGDTPEGASDLTGNVSEWTCSLFGPGVDDLPEFGYPYRAGDGREDLSAGPDMRRVLRGAATCCDVALARSTCRTDAAPDDRDFVSGGLRVALSGSSSPS